MLITKTMMKTMTKNNQEYGFKSLHEAKEHDIREHWRSLEEIEEKYKWVLDRASLYAEKCHTTQESVINSWESKRNYWWFSFYSEANQPEFGKTATVYTMNEWKKEAERRFGPNKMNWKFKCPSCGHVQSLKDFKDANIEPECAVTNCASRYDLGGVKTCKWTTGGFLRFNQTYVIDEEYFPHLVFDFAGEDK